MLDVTLQQRFKNLFLFLVQLFGLYILFFICVAFLETVIDLDLKKYSQDHLFKLLEENKLKAFLAMVVYAPVVEEFMFRTLIKPKTNELLLFLSSWSLFIISILLFIEIKWYYSYLLSAGIICGGFIVYKKIIQRTFLEKIAHILEKYQIITLQITSIIFGFIHIFNYVNSFMIDSILFLLIVPRIIAGHMFGKLKIKNGHIIWAIALHAFNNGIAFLIISSRY